MILAIDPGREKCGLAILTEKGEVILKEIAARREIAYRVMDLTNNYQFPTLVVGKSAFGKEVEKDLMRLDIKANIIFISEKYSTLEARSLYWQDHRPKGFWRLIPTSWRVPPAPIDDYAAVVLGKRYFKS
ncbi:MAG: resolvase [Candidatus Margulisbacteria bacterium]|nr:resolvase [Candidatus Margulisiibacteriota bacterium]